ncbi:hypothetical protein F4818DRAFT_426750 [Hypoxylon cercidicola]|nr:hypothetical protein F4818DRAFT_426750 [Hypoxylon cercidicola]
MANESTVSLVDKNGGSDTTEAPESSSRPASTERDWRYRTDWKFTKILLILLAFNVLRGIESYCRYRADGWENIRTHDRASMIWGGFAAVSIIVFGGHVIWVRFSLRQ